MSNIKLKDLLNEAKYIGSCVDVDNNSGKEICKYFPDATTMAQYVGNPDEDEWAKSKELSDKEWYTYIDKTKVPSKVLKGKVSYHYIAYDSMGKEMTPTESGLFFIYNETQDIHYFFKK